MNRLDRFIFLVALVLIIGGFGAIGAAAGIRVAIGTSTHVLDCSIRACVPLVREFNGFFRTFLVSGAIAMLSGGAARWWLARQLAAE